MKKKFYFTLLLLWVFLCSLGTITTKAENASIGTTQQEETYTYPVTPDDEAWAHMSYSEWVEVSNIPQELVDTFSTKKLIDAALDYPLKMDYLLFDTYVAGIQHMKNISNIYKELFTREDAPEILLETYNNLKVDYNLLIETTQENTIKKSNYDKELVLQFLLNSPEILDKMGEEQITKLTEVTNIKYKNKIGKCEDFSTASSFYQNSTTILSKLIEEQGTRPATSFHFIPAINYTFTTSVGGVFTGGSGQMYETMCDCGRFLENEYTPIEAAGIDGQFIGTYRTWVYKSGATKKYNCHSYCWIDKSYNNSNFAHRFCLCTLKI